MRDGNVGRFGSEPLTAGMEQVSPALRQAATGVLGGVVSLARLPTHIQAEFLLDGLHHLRRRIEAGQSLNNEGFDLAS
ncbi:hypothetical protein D3C81_1927110 [compost metagenome]